MSGALPMSNQPTLWDIPNATSLPAEDSGRSRSDKPDGQTTAPSGLDLVPAQVSARQAKDKDLATLVTSGLIGHDSSASAILQQSLESKLAPRLDTAGSTLFKLTWKRKTTPLGRSYLERAASALRTSDSGFTSWRSPNARLNGGGDYSDPEKAAKRLEQGHQLNLSEEALITSWPTPQTHDDKLRGNTAADNHYFPHDLSNAATLASWPSPGSNEGSGQMRPSRAATNRATGYLAEMATLASWRTPDAGSNRNAGTPSKCLLNGTARPDQQIRLADQVQIASWSTPKAEDSECAGAHRGTPDTLHSQANLAAWATPAERDYGTANLKSFEDRGGGKKGEQLQNQVKLLAGWPTPMAGSSATENYNEAGNNDSSRKTVALAFWPTPAVDSFRSRSGDRINEMGLDQMVRTIPECPAGPVRLTASGQMLTGSDAGMASSGQLNPEHSLWLQAIPVAWASYALRAMPSVFRQRKRSSKAISKQRSEIRDQRSKGKETSRA